MPFRRVSDGRGGLCDIEISPAVESMYGRMEQALAANQTAMSNNATFIAIAAPTNAQIVAQVKALSQQQNLLLREVSALLRLALGALDDTTGT